MLNTFSGRKASQNEFELRNFIQLLKDKGVRKYLEIGARHGDTFYEVMTSLPPGSIGVALDYPGALWGTHKSKNWLSDVVADLNAKNYQARAIFGDSTSPDVVEYLTNLGPFDAILIDGDHRYAGVKADWINYCNLAPIVAFHDIVGTGQREKVSNNEVEVPRLWAELKGEKQGNDFTAFVEFIDEGSAMGVGVVCKR